MLYGFELSKEEHVSYGDSYPNICFYVVRRHAKQEGICSVLNNFIAQLLHFEKVWSFQKDKNKVCIPVIDMLNYPSNWWRGENSENISSNDWELYFEQPDSRFDMNSIADAEDVTLGSECLQEVYDLWRVAYFWEDELIQSYHEIYQKYIYMNERVKNNIGVWEKEIFQPGRRVIGCFARMQVAAGRETCGREICKNIDQEKSDTIRELLEGSWPDRYPAQPTREVLVALLREVMKRWNATHVFVSIDDRETVEYLVQELGDRILYIPRRKLELFKNGKPSFERYAKSLRANEGKVFDESNIGYLTEIYLLSKCSSLVCGVASGSVTAIIMNGNQYEHRYTYIEGAEVIHRNFDRKFLDRFKKVFIYGTGRWGKYVCKEYFLEYGASFDGFVVSDGRRKNLELKGYPVYELSELELGEDIGIIVAVNESQEIEAALNRKGFYNYMLLNK